MQKVVPLNISITTRNLPLFHAHILLFKRFKQKNKIWLGHITYIPLKKGTPYDKALMESIYKTIKRELVNDAQFKDIDQAQMEIFKYIETY